MTGKAPGRHVGPWTISDSRTVFDNPWITVVDHDVAHPNGAPGQYGVVRFKNRAIGVLPITDTGETWLVGQHRFPLDAYSWELPEGGGPLDEEPIAAAKRELREETGLTGKSWFPLVEMDISNSVTDEAAVCYLVCDLEEGMASPEASEALEIRKFPFKNLLDDVVSGRIRDGLTMIMALTAQTKALRGDLPEAICKRILTGGR